jgi:uncharacterized protein with ParB-like and HNH nuclease domain
LGISLEFQHLTISDYASKKVYCFFEYFCYVFIPPVKQLRRGRTLHNSNAEVAKMKLWDVTKTQYKVSDFLGWQQSGALLLAPAYQRRSVWDTNKKSFLIDTILRGLPIPIIFIRERATDLSTYESKREVVDGQQRIRTVISFVDAKLLKKGSSEGFVLSKAHNKEFAGKGFRDLPDDYKKRILEYQFSVHILPNDVSDKELLSIFSRLNSTGVRLNEQELRNAEFFGEFKSSVYQEAPAQLNRWLGWKIFGEQQISRMDEVELVSELYMFMMNGVTGKSSPAIKKMYSAYDHDFQDREVVEERFRIVMDEIENRLGDDIRSTYFSKKTIFYTLFAVIYSKMFGLTSSFHQKAPLRVPQEFIADLYRKVQALADGSAPKNVLDAAARRTTHTSSRRSLFSYFLDVESYDVAIEASRQS